MSGIRGMMRQRCTIERKSGSETTKYNNPDQPFNPLAANVWCRFDEDSAIETTKKTDAKQVVIADATGIFLTRQDIKEEDQVTSVRTKGVTSSDVWEVVGVNIIGEREGKKVLFKRVK